MLFQLLATYLLFLSVQHPSSATNTDSRRYVNIDINTRTPVHIVDEKFLSVTLDFSIVRHMSFYKLHNERLLTLTKALAPAYLRLGGTAEDFLTFVPHTESNVDHPVSNLTELYELEQKYYNNPLNLLKPEAQLNLTGPQLDGFLKFKLDTGLELFIGLNVLKRAGAKWDWRNPKLLMDYVNSRNVLVHWELGNEPPFRKFNVSIEPEQLARDFDTLYQLKETIPLFWRSYIAGPDIGQISKKHYKADFYERYIHNAHHLLNAVTWHQYYLNSRTATLEEFTDPDIMDDLLTEIVQITNITRNYSQLIPIWLGETSSSYGGGAEGLSDSYVAGFLWLDKLGLSARHGIDIVMRQALFHGYYALLDDEDFVPRPDYWLSLIYKRLIGRQVFDVKITPLLSRIRMYSHCTLISNQYSAGSVVVFGMNIDQHYVNFMVKFGNERNVSRSIDQYVLTPENGDLNSKSVLLNGRKLEMPDRTTLPDLRGIPTDSIQLPPMSFGYFVLKDANASGCMRNEWGMENRIRIQCFSFDQEFKPYRSQEFTEAFFNDAEVLRNLFMLTSSNKWVTLAQPSTKVTVRPVPATVVSMAFFDRLEESGIVRESGSLQKCMDEFVDDFVISDELRKMFVMEESDHYDLYSDSDKKQFLYRLLRHICLGGQVCQYEDELKPYLDFTKSLYKDLVSVMKEQDSKQMRIISHIYEVSCEDSNGLFYPAENEHDQTFSYLVVDPLKRHVTVCYHRFGSGTPA